jgi:hypothetical protein
MRPKQFVRAHSMKQEFLIIHTQWIRMSKKKGTDHTYVPHFMLFGSAGVPPALPG